jgi:hypothetical protein
MTTVQTLTDSTKMKRQSNFGKAVWLSFAKTKELQSQRISQRFLQHFCFCPNAPKPTHHPTNYDPASNNNLYSLNN